MLRRKAGFIRAKLLAVGGACAVFCSAFPAWAALGGDTASVQADQIHMQGTRRTMATASYTVHEIQAASGTVVREYVSSEGKVFAVAFRGPWLPDLRQLLGSYFDQYSQAVQTQRSMGRRRSPVMIDTPGLSVQIGGHPRSFSGRAYVPEMMPSGVAAEEIQ